MKVNTIYNGDAYELIKQIPDKSIDLIVTDPPYEIVGSGSGGSFGSNHRDYHSEYKSLSCDNHLREGLRISHNYTQLKKDIKSICGGFDTHCLMNLIE